MARHVQNADWTAFVKSFISYWTVKKKKKTKPDITYVKRRIWHNQEREESRNHVPSSSQVSGLLVLSGDKEGMILLSVLLHSFLTHLLLGHLLSVLSLVCKCGYFLDFTT